MDVRKAFDAFKGKTGKGTNIKCAAGTQDGVETR